MQTYTVTEEERSQHGYLDANTKAELEYFRHHFIITWGCDCVHILSHCAVRGWKRRLCDDVLHDNCASRDTVWSLGSFLPAQFRCICRIDALPFPACISSFLVGKASYGREGRPSTDDAGETPRNVINTKPFACLA